METTQGVETVAPASGQPESVSAAINETNAKHIGAGAPAPGPAPRKRGNPNFIKGVPRSQQKVAGAGQVVAPSPEPTPIDKELVKKSVASLLKVVDGMVTRAIYRSAMVISHDDQVFSRAIVADAAMGTDEAELISGLSAEVCERWQLLGKYAPELLLGVCVVGYGARVWFTTAKLREYAEAQQKKTKGATDTQAK